MRGNVAFVKPGVHYFVFLRSSDEPHMEVMSKEELVEALGPDGDYHDITFGKNIPDYDTWPSDTGYIIKGEIVLPKPVAVVTKVEIE